MHFLHARFRRAAVGALTITLASFAAVASAAAQRSDSTIDSLARAFRAQYSPPALVIGVIDSSGKQLVLPYGIASASDSAPVTGDTRFEVGSVTKVFTSLLLARMAESGKVALDDPIGRYLPDSVHAPEYRGQQITLRELSTHSSSLPRLPTNIKPADMSDPYADYGAEKLYAFLDAYDLPLAPDSKYEYSNVGAGLLGFLLAHHAGKPFAELLEERVFQPLGMKDSYVAELGDSSDAQLTQGHAQGKPVAFWHFGSLEGAGAVRSTTNDLLRLLHAELHPESTPIGKAIKSSQKIRFHASPELSLALAWHVVSLPDSSKLYWHNGATGGARSFVAFAPEAGTGVVLLMNEALPLDVVNRFAFEVARAAVGR